MTLVGMSREQIEAHLDAGELETRMMSGRWWSVRRNGRTKTWKRDPDQYEIPIKAGFRSYACIMPAWLEHFRVKENER